MKLETSLQNGNLSEFCQLKVDDREDRDDQQVWQFIQANFQGDRRTALLSLLEYEPSYIRDKVGTYHSGKY